MDFIAENKEVAGEIFRVLKDGGQFVITCPSDKEGTQLGINIVKDIFHNNISSRKQPVKAILESLARMVVGLVYLPLLIRPNRIAYSQSEVETMITQLTDGDIQIETDPLYQDFIVYGKK
jgi:hypothetical protein